QGFMIPNSDENLKVYKDRYDAGEATLRFRHQDCCLLEKDLDEFLAGEYARREEYDKYNGWLTLGPLKMFKDGSIGARTALMREPYVDDPNNMGIDSLEQGLMETLVKKAAANGLQSVTHVIGDRAVELTNQAYEKVLVDGKNVLRNCLIHCELTGRDLLEYIRKTDSLIAYQPVFLQGDQYTMATRFKPELIRTSLACRTVIDMGIHASYGTDSPVEDCNPFANIYCAVNRKDLTGKQEYSWNPQECVTVEQAIDAYTVESAYMEFAEEYKGRIKPGFYADLEILDTDIFTCDPMNIINILPELVMVGGKIVYRK
ncbi:MAG: amidohydrolase family protein, partial [Firmicutes bacterium]|nr:amidohydrolase family protein [Bacillota bacterium]